MPNNPTWEETEEIDAGPSWDETSPESVSIPKPKPWELTVEGQKPDIGPWTQGPQQREEALAIYESMLQPPVTIPEFKGTTPVGKVAAGLGNVAGGLINMAASPVGLVTLPLAATPIGGPVIGGVFGGLAAKRAGETLGEASVTGDLQKYVEGGAEALMAPLMAHPKFARVELPPTIPAPVIKPVLGGENVRFRMEGTEDLSRRPLKAPKPIVPETVEELTPTVPETVPIQPEIATWEDAVTELKTRGTGTETKAQIQGMFPQLNLSKESAGGLAKDAWGENWKPAQQARQPAPEIKAIAAETKVEPEVVEKGVRVEANDHPEVAKTNPELLPTLVKDELTLDKKAYDKDVDPAKAALVEAAAPVAETAEAAEVSKEATIARDITDIATSKPWNLGYSVVMPEVEAQFYFPNASKAKEILGRITKGEVIETLGDLFSDVADRAGKVLETGQKGFKAYYNKPSEIEAGKSVKLDLKNPMLVREPYGYGFDESDLMALVRTAIQQGHDGLVILNESALPKDVLNKVDKIFEHPQFGTLDKLDDQIESLKWNNLKRVDWENGGHTIVTFDRTLESEPKSVAEELSGISPDHALDLYNSGKITKQQLDSVLSEPTPPPPSPEAQAKPAAAPTEAKPAVSEAKPSAKQPWEMTKDEYHDEHLDDVLERRKLATAPEGKKPRHPDDVHRESVKLAISEGKPVPAEVLADYPDLAPKQPWEMTRSDYVRSMRESEGIPSVRGSKTDRAMIASYETNHAASVADAVNSGKPVPAEVLADYPDLAPKPTEANLVEPERIRIGRQLVFRDKQLSDATRFLQRYYKDVLKGRKLTESEVREEIGNLIRRHREGTLDDTYSDLYSSLSFKLELKDKDLESLIPKSPPPQPSAGIEKQGKEGKTVTLSQEADKLLSGVPENINTFIGNHHLLRQALKYEGTPLAVAEGDKYTVRIVPSGGVGFGRGIIVVESKQKPGFPVVTGSWMDQWEPYMKQNYDVSKSGYGHASETKRADMEAWQQLSHWLEGKERDVFPEHFARTYYPNEWESWMSANQTFDKQGSKVSPFWSSKSVKHWKQRFLSEGKEASTEVAKTAIELPELRKADVRSDPRLEMPGITKQSKPNSLIVALRDLESVPVKEIVLKSTGDPIADAKKAEATIRKYSGQQNNVSLRESLAVTTGPNGRAILKFGMSPNGMVWASAKEWIDLVESRNKPITPGPGAQTVGETQKAQIEQLTDAFKGIEAEKTPLKEQVKEAFAVGEKFSGTKDLFSRALSGLKSSGDWIIQKWKAIPDIDNLLRAKGDLSAQLQANSWRTQKWIKQALKAVPRKRDQAAIAKWIDAGGDRAELERGMAETLPQYKRAYEDALNLKGDLLVAARNAQNYFESRLQEAVDAGVLKAGVEDYIHRIYESRPDVEQKAIAHVQDGILKANPALAKKRVFQFDWEAEKLGYKPVQSFITRLAVYESSLAKALAAREFIRKATTMKAADGRPIVDVKGVGIPLEDAETGERTGTLIKPQFNPAKANVEGTANYRGDYVNKEFPALSKWKWVSEDAAGKPILVQGDVAIHPDYVHRINALLEPSRVRYGRYGKVLKPAMAISSTVKQTMLDLSMFHQVQITVHGLEHKVLPWKILQDIDLDNPNVQGLLKGGISLGGEYSPYHAEGLVGASLTRHIPILGPLTESYHNWLFQSYIPRIKMTMALDALERNRARYKGELTEEQILHKTARQANSAFGELNYVMLERSKTAQDIARLIMLAPDFLEARGRFAAEALTKGGKSNVPGFGNEQRAALLLGALTLYVTARMANKMINDQYHFEPENAFSIVKDGHTYSLRTVQGDILHLLAKPLQFWMNRLNPVYGRTLLQIATGRDYFGRKRSVPETLWDSVANTMPIALRSSRERALWESIANSMGVQAKRWSDVDDAFTLAKKWKDAHGIGEKGEFIYDPDKDPLRSLKIALSHGDDAGAAKEIGRLTEGGTKIKKLNDYFDRYASMPFTGSAANDRKWQKELTEDEKKTVLAAREHKKSIKQLYLKARGQYFAAKNTPQ